MSTTSSSDLNNLISSNINSNSINASIDSNFRDDPAHRGSLTSTELDSIHQTASFKQAKQLEHEDKGELATKMQQLNNKKEST